MDQVGAWQLKDQWVLSYDAKIDMSLERIHEWYKHWEGKVYVSFLGGKDSTVLLHLVRSLYPDIPALFVDTGLEYPEIKTVVRQFENVARLRPKMHFGQVIEKYGWPVVSKRISQYIHECKPTGKNDATIRLRTTGVGPDGRFRQFSKIPNKWVGLINAPFKISHWCCKVMKKRPVHRYEKEHGVWPFIGMMAEESKNRELMYLQYGCNAFDLKRPSSNPLSFWTTQDILKYIVENNLPLAKCYGEIRQDLALYYYLTGVQSTGCMFCIFGAHLEPRPNRFEQMKTSHPKHYDYVMNTLGLADVLDFIGVAY